MFTQSVTSGQYRAVAPALTRVTENQSNNKDFFALYLQKARQAQKKRVKHHCKCLHRLEQQTQTDDQLECLKDKGQQNVFA